LVKKDINLMKLQC